MVLAFCWFVVLSIFRQLWVLLLAIFFWMFSGSWGGLAALDFEELWPDQMFFKICLAYLLRFIFFSAIFGFSGFELDGLTVDG